MSKSAVKARVKTGLAVLTGDKYVIPVPINELLELQELFPEINDHLAIIAYGMVLMAQIKYGSLGTQANVVQALPSVNHYLRNLLGRSRSVRYVSAAVAIQATLVAYPLDADSQAMIKDHEDLMNNLAGTLTTKGGLGTALSSEANLRAYRKGLMARTVGNIQAAPIFSTTKLVRDPSAITAENFLSHLPFPPGEITIEEIVQEVNNIIAPDGQVVQFVDVPYIDPAKVPLEQGLLIERVSPKIPDFGDAAKDESKFKPWQKRAIEQAKRLGGKS